MSDREIIESKGLGDQTKIKQRLEEVTREMNGYNGYPDAKKHQIVSFVKSGIRIAGHCLIPINILSAAIVLVLSEIVGVIEELV